MRYTIDFENKVITDEMIVLKVNEDVEETQAYGDVLGICGEPISQEFKNELWIMRDYADPNENDLRDFLREFLVGVEHKAVLGFIRRLSYD